MHVLIASVSSATSPTGVCRHAANIVRGMLAFPSVSKVTLLTGQWQADYFRDAFDLQDDKLTIKRAFISNRSVERNLWYMRDLPGLAKARTANIVHLAFPMPVRRSAGAAPVVVSLHDLYPFDIPQNFGKSAALNRAALKLCLHSVDAIACVSEETRVRMHELFPGIRLEKATVVPNSVYISHKAAPTPLHGALRDFPFLLCVAQHRANKNIPLLLRAFRLALDHVVVPTNTRLAVVGKDGPETQLLYRLVAEYGLEERVVFLRNISDSLLHSLYSNCKLVVAPSLLEGYGLPVVEALSAGSSVICSDIPAFRAIGADRLVFFDPRDSSGASLLAALRSAINVPHRQEATPVGLDPQQAAAMYLNLYASLLKRSRPDPGKLPPERLTRSSKRNSP